MIKKLSVARHIIVKVPEIQHKNRILKTVREYKQITYIRKPIRMTTGFSTQTLKTKGTWSKVFQALKKNKLQPRLIYPTNYLSKLVEK